MNFETKRTEKGQQIENTEKNQEEKERKKYYEKELSTSLSCGFVVLC